MGPTHLTSLTCMMKPVQADACDNEFISALVFASALSHSDHFWTLYSFKAIVLQDFTNQGTLT